MATVKKNPRASEGRGRRGSSKHQVKATVVEHHESGPPGKTGGLKAVDDNAAAEQEAGITVPEATARKHQPKSRRKPKGTQAQVLMALVNASKQGLLLDSMGQAFITVPVADHVETWPVNSRAFKNWARVLFYRSEGKSPSRQALADVVGLLEGLAQYDEAAHCEVPVRVGAGRDGEVWLDLGDPNWRAIWVTADGWNIHQRPELRFQRPTGLLPLPAPLQCPRQLVRGHLLSIRRFVNVSDEEWPLLLGWVVGAFNPAGPYPVLVLQGEQGSGKSTAAEVLRALIDPNTLLIRSLPRNEDDLFIAAEKGWVLDFDNLSGLSASMSDAICRLATGGGISKRKLYTDADEVILGAARPIILNGIDDIVRRNDLADRALVLTLPPIPAEERQPVREFWLEFEQAHRNILSSLLEAVARAIRNLDDVPVERLPRMADFTRWVLAAEPILPWEPGEFLSAYEANRAGIVDIALESDQVVQALLRLLEESDGEWSGTASFLLSALEKQVEPHIRRAKTWPKDATRLSGYLRRAATFLRQAGVDVTFEQVGHKKTRMIRVRRV